MHRGLRVTAGLFLAACWIGLHGRVGADGEEQGRHVTPAADLRVLERRDLAIGGGRIRSFSPDGRWLAVDRGPRFCVHDVETLAEQACVELSYGRIDLRTVAWSPDGARIAFTEDLFVRLHESDLWVLEVEGGDLTNLTDDGVAGSVLKPEAEGVQAQLDGVPAWSPDGMTLAFVRSPSSRNGTAIYRVSLGDNAPEKLLDVAGGGAFAVPYGLRWTDDGAHLVYSVVYPRSDEPNNGLWIADRDGRNARRVVEAEREKGPPFLIDVARAGDGDRALVFYYKLAAQLSGGPNVSLVALVDLRTGTVEPIKRAGGDATEFSGPINAVFSPDGSKLLYAYRQIGGEHRLVVRDLDGGDEHVLATFKESAGAIDIGQGLVWAGNDWVYVARSPASGVLLKLGTE